MDSDVRYGGVGYGFVKQPGRGRDADIEGAMEAVGGERTRDCPRGGEYRVAGAEVATYLTGEPGANGRS
jgi:hypothetical protein